MTARDGHVLVTGGAGFVGANLAVALADGHRDWELVALDNLHERQLPFATMKALNECATLFQADERSVMQREFTIRRPWTLQGVKMKGHAKKKVLRDR